MTDEMPCSRYDVATILLTCLNDTNKRAFLDLGESLVCFSFNEGSSSCDPNFRAAVIASLAVARTVALAHERFMNGS